VPYRLLADSGDTLVFDTSAAISESSLRQDSDKSATSHPQRAEKSSDKSSTVTVDKMVVTAGRIREYTPSKVTLDAKNFSGRYIDLQSVLETVSGVTIGNRGGFGHYADVSIRGSAPSQVQVYLDGVPLNGASGNPVDISKIPFSSLQTICIYKTTPPLEIFGDNAGGVLNLTTNSTKDAATASMEVGSYGYREGSAMLTKTMGRMNHCLSVNYGWADNDYPYTDSVVTHSSTVATDDSQKTMDNNFYSTLSSLYQNTFRINDRNKLTSQLSVFVTDEGIYYLPMAGLNDGTVRNNTVALLESYAATLDKNLSITVAAKAQTQDEAFRRFQKYYLTTPTMHDVSQPYGSLEGIIQESFGDHALLKGILSASYNGFEYNNLLTPADQIQPHYVRLTGKAGMEANVYVCKEITARLGGIYRYEVDSANDSLTTYGTAVPGGGMTKKGFPAGFAELRFQPFNCLGILASIQYGSRSPGFSEKYGLGAHVSGNPALRPETRLEYDLGFSFIRHCIALSGAIFASATRDKIVYVNHSTMFTPMNVSDINGWGVENDATLMPFSWVSVVNSVTYMENIVRSDLYSSWNGKDEPLQPRFTDNLTIKLSYKNWYASHSARFVSRYFTGFDNLDTMQQSKPQLNASIGCTFWEHFDISYRIENYLNVQNYDFQRPLPGLSQYAVLKCTF
jgi:outer membrane cobalamin receptor